MRQEARRGRVVAALALAAAVAAPAAAQDGHGGAPAPAVGDLVAAFDGQALDGTMKRVAFDAKGSTVLLFFLSSCPTCHRMIPEWNRAFQRRSQGLAVVGVLMDREPPGFFSRYPVAFPVVRAPGREFLQRLKVSRAPLMLRVARGGRVEDVAVGLNDPIRVGEMFRP